MRMTMCCGLIFAVALTIACSADESSSKEEYNWLAVRAFELKSNQDLLLAVGQLIAFPHDEATDEINIELVKRNYPLWIKRHNQEVQQYNARAERFDWTDFDTLRILDQVPVRFDELRMDHVLIKAGPSRESPFNEK